MSKTQPLLIVCSLAALTTTNAFAQQNSRISGFSADVTAALVYDSNILRTAEAFEREDEYAQVRPELKLTGLYGKHKLEGTYNGNYALYSSFSDVNYDDHVLSLKGTLDHSFRLNSIVEVGYHSQHEEPGDSDRIFNNFTEFNLFNRAFFDYKVEYGRNDSQGQLILSYRLIDSDFTNNFQDFRDRLENRFLARMYYRIFPKTRLLAEAIYTDADHALVENQFERDNTNEIYQVGAAWDITNVISGEFKVGYQARDFDSEIPLDVDGVSYD